MGEQACCYTPNLQPVAVAAPIYASMMHANRHFDAEQSYPGGLHHAPMLSD